MVYNALAGIAVGYALGMTDDQIKAGIEALVPLAGRNNLIETGKFTVIDDCYNANPVSMKSSIDVLKKADTRTVAVLGDMFELGDNEKAMHFDVGVHAAKSGVDVLICIGALSEEMAKGARETNAEMEIHHYADKDTFFEEMDRVLEDGDTILVKASHGMAFAQIVERLQKN